MKNRFLLFAPAALLALPTAACTPNDKITTTGLTTDNAAPAAYWPSILLAYS